MSVPTRTSQHAANGRNGNRAVPQTRAKRRQRDWRGGNSLLAYGEPMLWLTASGLIICLAMITLLLAFIVYEGLITFWPTRLTQVATISHVNRLGEVVDTQEFRLDYSALDNFTGEAHEAAKQILNPLLKKSLGAADTAEPLEKQFRTRSKQAWMDLAGMLERSEAIRKVPVSQRQEWIQKFATVFEAISDEERTTLASAWRDVMADSSGDGIFSKWREDRDAEDQWVASDNVETMLQSLRETTGLRLRIWSARLLSQFAQQIAVPHRRRLMRTGNFELTNDHFTWVNDLDIAPDGEQFPGWGVLIERTQWGRFYGFPKAFRLDGNPTTSNPNEVWDQLTEQLPIVRTKWHDARQLEREEIGEISRLQDQQRLELRRIELSHGVDSREWKTANDQFEAKRQELSQRADAVREKVVAIDKECDRYELVMETSQGQEKVIKLSEVVRVYLANQLSLADKWRIYGARWHEFLFEKPREANSEGGVLPAIFGTVAMTLLMTALVVPFGVLAALYLREYAKGGLIVRIVRIAVNNLAGVPSIVFGIFGLGFFCYIVGAGVDQLFFTASLPSPTFGTGGILWSAFTLSLLTLPVVIVATEEALSAVPNSLREGSYACGASKWQTIRRIVLPHALPGIMTGMILAMARGAGEVAPLMLVGARKIADELPVDGVFPYVHLERSFMHLGFHIYDLGFQSPNSEAAKPMVFTTTLLLILVIATLNIAAIYLRSRLRRQVRAGHF